MSIVVRCSSVQSGDLLIRGAGDARFAVLDACSNETLAVCATFNEAISFAARRNSGAVWHQATDNRGRPMGDPTIVLPRVR